MSYKLEEFFRPELDDDYFGKRYKIGETYAHIGLPLTIYFAAMHRSLKLLTEELYDDSLSLDDYLAAMCAVSELIHPDTSLAMTTATMQDALVNAFQRLDLSFGGEH